MTVVRRTPTKIRAANAVATDTNCIQGSKFDEEVQDCHVTAKTPPNINPAPKA